MNNRLKNWMPNLRHQSGLSTLMMAVILLVVLLMMSLFASRFQIFEQKTSVNKVRSAMAASVSEAAINQGLEYIKANAKFVVSDKEAVGAVPAGWLSASTPRWEPCSNPVDAGEFDPCLAEVDEDRRARMYRFVSDGETRLPLENIFDNPQVFDQVGAYDANYDVFATLCRVDTETNPAVPDCALEPPTPGPIAITLVSRANLPSENARSTVKSTIATARIISNPPNVPLIAAGIVSGLGSAEIVPNPNAGGVGVPLSIWTNSNVDITKEAGGAGAFATCHLGEFLQNFSGANGPEFYDGITKCTSCTCSGLPPDRGLISGKDPGTPGYEGIDVMDIDGNANGDLPDTSYFPREPLDDPNNNFDDSVFEYTFGVDVVDEGSTAVRMDCITDENPGGNCETQFLLDIGATIINDCSSLSAASEGVYWVVGACAINQQVGTPSAPVALIVDGCLDVKGQTEFYGLLYVRAGCANPDEAFSAAGGGQIYGAVVSDGGVKIRGSIQMIYNEAVLNNLGNSPAFMRFGFLPGSWSDDVCPNDGGLCGE